VRELEHWIESAIVLSPDGRVTGAREGGSAWRRGDAAQPSGDKPLAPGGAPQGQLGLPLGLSLDDAISRYAEATVDACDGNKTEAAKKLGIGRNTLGRLLRR
jgi:DNA-binding NtrC family response regulator